MVLTTLGAPQRRLLGGRRARSVSEPVEPEPVPTVRATLVRPEGMSDEEAAGWLGSLRSNAEALEAEADGAVRELNLVLRAQRAAAVDPYVREVSRESALVVRVGYGEGERVADGRFAEAIELPRGRRRRPPRGRVELEPQERLAALLGGHDSLLVGEELVLRARADLDAGRGREAALQARIALEALLAELDDPGDVGGSREAVASAANAALDGELSAEQVSAVDGAVAEMERALRKRALRRAGSR